jgi:FAD:protein FMN transferase
LPDSKQLAALVAANPSMQDISFISQQGITRASSRNRQVQLDLGGYAKGYALDRAAALLKQQGIQHALLNIGGNVLALGTHGPRAWRVGIQHPRQPGPLATLALHDGEAIGTSGDYQRYFELGGTRYCHLIDPRNGQAAQGVQAVTVLTRGARAGVLSDATSKPLFISAAGLTADRGAWLATAQKMQLSEALLVDSAGTVHLTAGMQKRLEFIDKNIRIKLAH